VVNTVPHSTSSAMKTKAKYGSATWGSSFAIKKALQKTEPKMTALSRCGGKLKIKVGLRDQRRQAHLEKLIKAAFAKDLIVVPEELASHPSLKDVEAYNNDVKEIISENFNF